MYAGPFRWPSLSADYMVSVEVQRLSGPESAAYGLVLRHTEGSYYLFSVRDDGYFLLSLWGQPGSPSSTGHRRWL